MLLAKLLTGRPASNTPYLVGPVQARILGFVNARPQQAHGVGIARYIRDNVDAEVADAQIYVAIKRLETRGFLVAVNPDETGFAQNTPSERVRGRPRKYYSLTSSGMGALKNAVEGISNSDTDRSQKAQVLYGFEDEGPALVG